MSDIIERYEKNRNLRLEGKYPGLPIHLIYPILGKYIPSIPREVMLIIMASTGAGKTQFWKRLALNLCNLHVNDPKMPQPLFICNLLEESVDEFEDSLMAMVYYDTYEKDILTGFNEVNAKRKRERITKMKLNSYTKDILTDEELEDLKTVIYPKVKHLMNTYFHINDNLYHPFGLYKFAKDKSKEIGIHYHIEINVGEGVTPKIIPHTEYNKLSANDRKRYIYHEYKLNDENVFPVVVTDHMELISPERDKETGIPKSKWDTMRDWSFEYGRKDISKKWKFNLWNILQMNAESQKKTYDYKSQLNWESLKPTLDSISANKVIAQDHHVILALFDPNRYSTNTIIDGIDLIDSKGRYRSNTILKNRIGPANAEIQLYFDGATSTFYEILNNSKDKTLFDLVVYKVRKAYYKFYDLVKR